MPLQQLPELLRFLLIPAQRLLSNIDRLAAISQALSVPLDSLFKGAMIPDGSLLDNLPANTEEFDQYMREVGRKVDDRTKVIIMRICGELSNLTDLEK